MYAHVALQPLMESLKVCSLCPHSCHNRRHYQVETQSLLCDHILLHMLMVLPVFDYLY